MRAIGQPLFARRVLPGFGLSLGFTLAYLTVLVAVPLAACLVKVSSLTGSQFVSAVWTERARAAYLLTFGVSFAAAAINVPLGLLLAWILVRYEFPFKRVFDSLIDLPFALPTAVAGLVYANLYVANGWLGRFLIPLGIYGAYSRFAIVLVLTFIGLPFVVRTVQPVLETIDAEIEEAAASLGATRLQTFFRVLLPSLVPALTTGFAPHVRPLAGRIRFGRLRLRQHHVQDGDRAGADREPAGGIPLRRGDGHRPRPARRLVCHAGRD